MKSTGRFKKYVLQAAMLAACAATGDVTLSENVALDADADWRDQGTVTIGAGVTLDGDGHKVSGGTQIAVDAAGGTVKNVAFDGIGSRTAPVAAVVTAEGLTNALTVTGCTFTNDGYAKTNIVVKPAAGAKVTVFDLS